MAASGRRYLELAPEAASRGQFKLPSLAASRQYVSTCPAHRVDISVALPAWLIIVLIGLIVVIISGSHAQQQGLGMGPFTSDPCCTWEEEMILCAWFCVSGRTLGWTNGHWALCCPGRAVTPWPVPPPATSRTARKNTGNHKHRQLPASSLQCLAAMITHGSPH